MAGKAHVMEQSSKKLAELFPPEMTQTTGWTIDHLCDMHYGIGDYWALTTLWGARPEDEFSLAKHSLLMLERLKSLHLKPGTEYSYANTKFHILGRIIEEVTKEDLGHLLAQRIFAPAGMQTAQTGHRHGKAPESVGWL